MIRYSIVILFASGALAGDLDYLKLPSGFSVSIFSDQVPGARTLALGKSGTVFVGTAKEKVYAVLPSKKVITLYDHLVSPNGVLVMGEDLFIGEISKISQARNIEGHLGAPPALTSVFANLPTESWHGFRVLREGPDHQIYFGIGAPCNFCETKDPYGSLSRLSKDQKKIEVVARGVRNTVGFNWDPMTKELWFTDNGRDMLGDDLPPDELNHLVRVGENFGFPWCHGGFVPDPDLNKGEAKHKCDEFSAPAQKLGAHVAALGLHFYTGKQFPSDYRNQIFIAEHGSWNRSRKTGYRIAFIRLHPQTRKVQAYETFMEGWLGANEEVRGRPVAFLQMPDGSLLVSDDFGGKIFRITYKP